LFHIVVGLFLFFFLIYILLKQYSRLARPLTDERSRTGTQQQRDRAGGTYSFSFTHLEYSISFGLFFLLLLTLMCKQVTNNINSSRGFFLNFTVNPADEREATPQQRGC
jgi:hypothetical protein